MSPRLTRAMEAGVVAFALGTFGAPARAQLTGELPDQLQGIEITQRLDAQVPMDLRLTDSEGRTVRLGSLFRPQRPVVLTLVYYRCPMLCSLVLEGLVRGLDRLEWTPGEQFDIVTVSIDPREGAALAQTKKRSVLGAYGRPQAAAGWHFLTADARTIETLAEAVGFRYRFVPETGEYAHGAALFVLTPEGRTSRYLFGVDHDPRTLRLSLVEAAEGKIGTAIDQFLLYCYRYDAAEGRYVPIAWRLMRLGGILTVLLLGGTLFTLWMREARQRRAVA